MSMEENKTVIRRFYETINAGSVDQIDQFFTSDYVDHNPQAPTPDLAGLKQLLAMIATAFPDFHLTAEDMRAEGDRVVARLSLSGTNQGSFMGIPPTGKQITTTGLSIFRLTNGKIAEEWFLFDALGVIQQLGGLRLPSQQPAGSIEANKAAIRRFYEEFLSRGDLAVADELCAPDYAAHFLPPWAPNGVEGLKQILTMYRTAFPDVRSTIEDLIAEGDQVIARATTRGTHRGAFMGIPPTGKQVAVIGIDAFRLVDGKIVEHWLNRDDVGILQQLGMMPEPGQS